MHNFFLGVAAMFPARLPLNIARTSTSRNLFEGMRQSPWIGMAGSLRQYGGGCQEPCGEYFPWGITVGGCCVHGGLAGLGHSLCAVPTGFGVAPRATESVRYVPGLKCQVCPRLFRNSAAPRLEPRTVDAFMRARQTVGKRGKHGGS